MSAVGKIRALFYMNQDAQSAPISFQPASLSRCLCALVLLANEIGAGAVGNLRSLLIM